MQNLPGRFLNSLANCSQEHLRPLKRRRQTEPRSKQKCDGCRRRKCKCVPVNRDWEKGERCLKCIENNEPCGPHRCYNDPVDGPVGHAPELGEPPPPGFQAPHFQPAGYGNAYGVPPTHTNPIRQAGFGRNVSGPLESIGNDPNIGWYYDYQPGLDSLPAATPVFHQNPHQASLSMSLEAHVKQG